MFELTIAARAFARRTFVLGVCATALSSAAQAQPGLTMTVFSRPLALHSYAAVEPRFEPVRPSFVRPEPPTVDPTDDAGDAAGEIAPSPTKPRFARQVVAYPSAEAPGTIVIDTPNTYLYYVLGGGKAIRYGIGVGRQGFTWAGTQHVSRKAEWPDWTPPPEMIQRQPYLPRFMAGGPQNPLGARAIYLGSTVYRIHGTNAPATIGGRVSSGCIRLRNADVIDLYTRVKIGTKVVVLPMSGRAIASSRAKTRGRSAALSQTAAH